MIQRNNVRATEIDEMYDESASNLGKRCREGYYTSKSLIAYWIERRHRKTFGPRRPGLTVVAITSRIHGLDLDLETEQEFRRTMREVPIRDCPIGESIDALSIVRPVAAKARAMMDQATMHLERLNEAIKRIDDHAKQTVIRLRVGYLLSPSGLLQLIMTGLFLGVIGLFFAADWMVAQKVVFMSRLFDTPAPDPRQPVLDPSLPLVASVCIVPIALLCVAIKLLLHPPRDYGTKVFKFLAAMSLLLAVMLVFGFAYIIGGHDSVLVAFAKGDLQNYFEPQKVMGIAKARASLPCEYVAIQMLGIAIVVSGMASYLPRLIHPFFDRISVGELRHHNRRLIQLRGAVVITAQLQGKLDPVMEWANGQERKSREALETKKNEFAAKLAEVQRALAGAALLFFLPLAGCVSPLSTTKRQQVLTHAAARATVQKVDEKPKTVHVIVADGMPNETIVPWIEICLSRMLAGGSELRLFNGDHNHIVSLQVPFGPPEIRIENDQLLAGLQRAEAFFEKRTGEGSLELDWPSVVTTLLERPRPETEQQFVVLAGDPCYRNSDDPALTFDGDRYPSHGLLAADQLTFNTRNKFRLETHVSILTPNSQWGDSRLQREAVTQFHSVYWKALGARLDHVSSSPATIFDFEADPSVPQAVLRLSAEPKMFVATPPIEPGLTPELPPPVIIPTQHRIVSLREPGTLAWQIEMGGGSLEALRSKKVMLTFFIDTSTSMGDEIDALKKVCLRIAEQLPELVESLEITVIAASGGLRRDYPSRVILDASQDGGRSFARFGRFLDDLEIRNGDALTSDMIIEAVRKLHANGQGKHTICLALTDVFHIEGDSVEIAKKQAVLLAGLHRWTHSDRANNRFISLFSGDSKTPDNSELSFDEQRSMFLKIAGQHPNNVFAKSPDVLIDELIAFALEGKSSVDRRSAARPEDD